MFCWESLALTFISVSVKALLIELYIMYLKVETILSKGLKS